MNKELSIHMDTKVLRKMENHAKLIFPNECCGFFFGDDSGQRIITDVKTVQNSKNGDQRRRFKISPVDYMEAEQYALENDVTLLGVFHSHPLHKAIPSVHDLRQALPYFSYIIISVYSRRIDHVRSWRLNEENKFDEEIIYLTDKNNQYGKNYYSHTA